MWANKNLVKRQIYADGACKKDGVGGWGAVIITNYETTNSVFGGEFDTTNNRMELKAVIEALKSLPEPSSAELYTDSQYVQKGISEWIVGWKRRGWKTATGTPVKNVDLWKELDKARERHAIEWRWVKGHSGDPGNEFADKLANKGVDLARKQAAENGKS